MKNYYRLLFVYFLFFVTLCEVNAQQINLVRFNNTANYTAGSGVSVIINPTGIFELNNHFILELSDNGGTWNLPTPLNDLTEFYVPVLNGTLPAGLAAGTYKLRVRATTGLGTTPESYPSIETESFNVVSGTSVGIPFVTSELPNNSTFFNCAAVCPNTTNTFGSLIRSAIDKSSALTNKKITICSYVDTDVYNVTLIDVLKGTQTLVTYDSSNGIVTIPSTLGIGTYVFEIEKNNESVYSVVFLFHGNGTSLGNSTSEVVCVGSEVSFTVDVTSDGIGRNYMGSQYKIDFGDGTAILELTQAQLLLNPTVTHTYNIVSCATTDSKFTIKKTLLNKGIYSLRNSSDYCTTYYSNGNGVEKKVNVSLAPKAAFSLANKQCKTQDIVAANATTLGSYGSAGSCEDAATFTWYYKKPSGSDFVEVTNLSWINNSNPKLPSLRIPASFITETGCWDIKLMAVNNDLCQTITEDKHTIKIEAQPLASFTNSPSSPICANTQIQFTNTSNVVSLSCQDPTYLWSVSPVVGTPATSSGFQFVNSSTSASVSPKILFTQPGSYRVTLSVTNSCGTATSSKQIDVFGDPSVSFNPDALNICDAAPAGYTIDFNQTGTKPAYSLAPYAPTSFLWTISGAGVTAADYSFTGGTATSQYPKITFNAYKTYTITVSVNGNCAGSNQATFSFTLNQTPIITNTVKTQTICSGSSSTAIALTSDMSSGTTFTWTTTATTGITGIMASGSGSVIPATVFTNLTNASGTVTYKVTPINNGCAGIPVDFVITIAPKPVVSDKAAAICSGTAFTVNPTNIVGGDVVAPGTTYTWTVSAPAGIMGTSDQTTPVNSISQTLSNNTNAPLNAVYTVTPISGSCIGANFTITVTVNPIPTIVNVTPIAICSGSSFSVTPTNGGGISSNDILPSGTTYSWSAPIVTVGITGGASGTDQTLISGTLTNTSYSDQTATYTVTPKSGNCPGATFTVVVKVNASVKFDQPVNQVLCNNGATSLVSFSTTNTLGTTSYNWTNNNTSIGLVASGSGNIPSFTATNNGASPVTATISVTPTLTNGGVSCTGTAKTFTITVNPTPEVTQPIDLILCKGQSTSVNFGTTNGGGTNSYNWTNDNPAIGLVASGNGNISFSATNTDTAPIIANITVTPSFSNGGVTCTGSTKTFKITVNPSAQVNLVANSTVCNGDVVPLTPLTSTNTEGTLKFDWSNDTASIGLNASGTGDIPSFTAVNNTTTPIVATITITPTYTNGSVTCTGTPKTFKITVNPTAQINAAANQIVCDGSLTTAINFTSNNTVGSTVYSWINDTSGIGLALSGSGNIPSFNAVNTGTVPVSAKITVTPTFTNGGVSCVGTPMIFTITINPKGQVNAVANQTVCNGTSTSTVNFSTNNTVGTINYSWTNSNATIGLAASGFGNITAFNAINNGTSPVSATIIVKSTFANGASSCPGTPQTFTITVNPSPSVAFSPGPQTICSDGSTAAVTLTSSTPGSMISWTASQPDGITGMTTSGTTTIPVQTLSNSTNVPITITYLGRAITNDASACSGALYPYTVTVNPKPTVIVTPSSQTICSNATTNIALTGAVVGETFTWTVSSNTNVTGASAGSGNMIRQTLINNSASPQDIIYTIIPSYSHNRVICSGEAITSRVTVNPKPVITANIGNQTICSETNTTAVTLSSTTAGVTYSWTAIQPVGISGVVTSGAENTIPVQNLTNSTNNPVVVSYLAIATTGGDVACAGTAFPYTVTVNPVPTITNILDSQNSCNGDSTTAVAWISNVTGTPTVYNWTGTSSSANITGFTLSGSGNLPTMPITNSGNTIETVTYLVTPSVNGCAGIPFTYKINVNPIPVMDAMTSQTICGGNAFTTPVFNSTVAGTIHEWKLTSTGVPAAVTGYPVNGTGELTGAVIANTGTVPYKLVYSVTPSANGCKGSDKTFELTVNPAPSVGFDLQNQTICNKTASRAVAVSSATPNVKYSWNIPTVPAGLNGVTSTSGNTGTIPAFTLENTTGFPIDLVIEAQAVTNDNAGCPGAISPYVITVNPTIELSPIADAVYCNEAPTAAINFTASQVQTKGIVSYKWSMDKNIGALLSGVGSIPSFNAVNTTALPITAVVTVTPVYTLNTVSCDGIAKTFTITVNPTPLITNTASSDMICSNGSSRAVVWTSNITNMTTIYDWAADTNGADLSGFTSSGSGDLPAMTIVNSGTTVENVVYKVTASANGCTGMVFNYTISVNPIPSITNIPDSQNTCNGDSTTAVAWISSVTGTPTVYNWTGTSSSTNITGFTSSGSGNLPTMPITNSGNTIETVTYIVTPSVNGCAGIPFTYKINVNPIPTTLSLTDKMYCKAVPTSEIAFSNLVSGTTYSWTNSNPAIGLGASGTGNIPVFIPTNATDNPITATISVTATANGCSRMAEIYTITVNPSPSVAFSESNQTICSQSATEQVELTSPTPNAKITWTAVQPNGITGVATSGTNTIPVQTLVNSTSIPITITYNATASTGDVSSVCDGALYPYTITVNPTPKVGDYERTICNETNFTVIPINGDPDSNAIVPVNTTYTWTVVPNTNVTGWSNQTIAKGNISQTLTNTSNVIQIVEYTVLPMAFNCIGTAFKITVKVYPTPIVAFSQVNQTICNETASNSVLLSTNAVGTISYQWNAVVPNGITGADLAGTAVISSQTLVNSTNMPLTVLYKAVATIATDDLACPGPEAVYSITVNPTIISSGVKSNYKGYGVNIFGGNNGAIDVTVSGGSGSYTYNWTGPNGFAAATQDISGVLAGNYTIAIDDGYCSPVLLNFVLTQPPELKFQEDLSVHMNLKCFGDSDGALGITITQESVSPYDFQLVNSTGGIIKTILQDANLSQVFTGLIADTYSVVITDANGGVKELKGIVITQPATIVITPTTTPITCYGGGDGSITLNVTGGTAPYTSKWDNLASGLVQNNLSSGTYQIVVTDSNGCTKSITVVLPDPPVFKINPVVSNISCFGANDGSIKLNLEGGIAPVNMTWSDGSTAGLTRNNLLPGVYSFEIKDSKPCSITGTFIIVEPQLMVLSANVTDALDCDNANSGGVNLMVSGGTAPFKYVWSNGTQTEDLTNVPAGNYSVTVTDARGCGKTALYKVTRPAPIVLDVQNSTTANCDTKLITSNFVAQVTGGVPPYLFNWSSGTVGGTNNQSMTTTENGMVIIEVKDILGCISKVTFDIKNPVFGTPLVDANSIAYNNYGHYSILDPIKFTTVSAGFFTNVIWDFGDGTYSNELNPEHIYVSPKDYVVVQTINYPFGCVEVNKMTLSVDKGYLLVVPTAFTPNGDTINDTFRPVTKGLTNIKMDVYDTLGSMIYSETGNVLKGWDGKIKGHDAENGNYNCKVSAKTFYGTIVTDDKTFVLIK